MFWKKKKKANSVAIEDPLDDAAQQRTAFRYAFKRKDRPIMIFKKTKVLVINISAGGVAFYSNQTFRLDEEDNIHMKLEVPGQWSGGVLTARVRILGLKDQRICHCKFEKLAEEQHELIHQYVLELQKRDLRRQQG